MTAEEFDQIKNSLVVIRDEISEFKRITSTIQQDYSQLRVGLQKKFAMGDQQRLHPNVEVFRKHYEDDSSQWGKHSGGGSDPFYTIEYRCFLEKFIGMNNIKSIVDIGCGDWQFSRFLNLSNIEYLGLDVVPSVIQKNLERFASENIKFSLMYDDLTLVPPSDLLIMKDVLQHLPNENIHDFSTKVFSKFKFCLLTNSFRKLNTAQNIDIGHGAFRCLDLRAPPYSLKGSYVLEFSSPLWEQLRTFLYQP